MATEHGCRSASFPNFFVGASDVSKRALTKHMAFISTLVCVGVNGSKKA